MRGVSRHLNTCTVDSLLGNTVLFKCMKSIQNAFTMTEGLISRQVPMEAALTQFSDKQIEAWINNGL